MLSRCPCINEKLQSFHVSRRKRFLRVGAAESIGGMQSPRSAGSVLDGQAWPACGSVAEVLLLYAAAWEHSCVLW